MVDLGTCAFKNQIQGNFTTEEHFADVEELFESENVYTSTKLLRNILDA